jgi:hypothetical protein
MNPTYPRARPGNLGRSIQPEGRLAQLVQRLPRHRGERQERIYVDYLPAAFEAKAFRAAPGAVVAGEGLAPIPAAIDQLKKGVSARTIVVRI